MMSNIGNLSVNPPEVPLELGTANPEIAEGVTDQDVAAAPGVAENVADQSDAASPEVTENIAGQDDAVTANGSEG